MWILFIGINIMDLRDVAMGNLACSWNGVHEYKEKEETEITI